jgi:sporulation protein YlmC with PRC-barrel domain
MSDQLSSSAESAIVTPSSKIAAQPIGATLSISLLEVDLLANNIGFPASAILGRTVVNDAEVTVGKIEDLIIDPNENVLLAVLSVGGFLGMGAKHIAVSFAGLEIGDTQAVYPNATREALEGLPDESGATGIRATKVIGATVVNQDGETVGTIDDLIVTPARNVAHAVLSVGGFLGIGKKHVVIPYHVLETHDGQLVFRDATRDSLKELPEFKYLN